MSATEKAKTLDDLRLALTQFLTGREGPPASPHDLAATYTRSPAYLKYCSAMHHEDVAWRAFDWLLNDIREGESVVEAGCLTGMAGLRLAAAGKRVTFHDFEGLALEFIRWYIQQNGVTASVVPYGKRVEQHDWCVSFDVLEHTCNVLGAVRWFKELGRTVAMTYPIVPYQHPHVPVIDEWIDHEALMWVLEQRYEVLERWERGTRKFIVYR